MLEKIPVCLAGFGGSARLGDARGYAKVGQQPMRRRADSSREGVAPGKRAQVGCPASRAHE